MNASKVLRAAVGAVGVAIMAVGIGGLWVDRVHTRPWLGARELWSFWLSGALVHDVILVPVALAATWLVRRFVPARIRPPISAAIFATAIVTLISLPALRGYGRRPANPTILPRDYATGLAVTLAVVWAIAAGWTVLARMRPEGECPRSRWRLRTAARR